MVRELTAFPRCSVCEQLKAEERSSARWSLLAPVLLNDSRWQSGPVPWSWGSRSGSLETASGRGRRPVHPLTCQQPANDFLCPCAHVSVSFGLPQLFSSKLQIAHISIYDGNEKKPTPGRTSSLRPWQETVVLVPQIQRCCVCSQEFSGHTGRAIKRRQARRSFSRCSYLKWSWIRERSFPVHASVSSASYYLRSWPGRWCRTRPAAPARRSTVQEGLAPATRNCPCPLRVGNPTHPRSCCLLLVHSVRTFPIWKLLRVARQVGSHRLVAMVSVRRQGRWSLYRMSGHHQRFRTRALGLEP